MRLMMIGAVLPLALSAALAAGRTPPAEFYVATYGSDTNPGTQAKPFATLDCARDAIRTLKQRGPLPAGGMTVWIREGVYQMERTFELTAEDSGGKDAPITYRSCKGEQVRLVGGREVRYFHCVTNPGVLGRMDQSARGNVLQADLRSQGITNFGKLSARGFGRAIMPAHLELFFEGRPMTLARWPNREWAVIADVPAGPSGGKFTYDGDRPNRWSKAEDIWLHGYWTWAWADSYEKVKSIDTQAHEIATEPPHGVYGYQKGKRYRVLNLLEELDEPGEWYLDRKTGMLYFWPPAPVDRGDVYVSILEEPMVSMKGVSYITIRDLALEQCRGKGVVIEGGTGNRIAGCTLRNIGTVAAEIRGGTDNGIQSCDIYETGDGAVTLIGGDRKRLTAGRNYVENCFIHDFSRWCRTYRPAVLVQGVGNRVAHNLIKDAPHSAIILGGNDHIIEFNDISNICRETGDAGAFYMGRDWTQRGNVVRCNYFHGLGGYEDKFSAHHFSETMAVYLDDFSSGTLVYGNVFYKANRAVMIGGGRDNTVDNNIFADCKLSVFVDARGLGWAKSYIDGSNPTLYDRFKDVNADKPPYTTRYPQLATILSDEPGVPKGNKVMHNISVGGTWLQLAGVDEGIVDIRDNVTEGDPGFVDAANQDFRLKADSPVYKLGFEPIPMDKIGLYKDEYRTQVIGHE